jgi:NAD-dependent histone deacetylase SIR2
MRLIHKHNLLERVFTQNIDTLELAAGIPRSECIFAHGSFATQRCIDCKADFPREKLEEAVSKADPELARCEVCGGLVKPDIVFFGEALPDEFHKNRELPAKADLAIIIGSSLSVHPFASLPQMVREDTPRVLLNMEKAGGIGSRCEDVVWLGACDEGVRILARELGWEEEMMDMWRSYLRDEEKPIDVELNDDNLESEVEKLTKEVDKGLQVSEAHKNYIEANLKKKQDIWSVKRTEGDKTEEEANGALNGGTNGESKV